MPAPNEQMRKQNKQMGLTFAVVVVAAMVLFAGGSFLFTRAFTGHIATPADYKTMSLAGASYSDRISADGSIQSAVSVAVTPEVDGVVETVSVKDGDKVSKGDVLFTMKNDTIAEAATAAGKEYSAAKSAKNSAQKRADKANAALTEATKALKKAQKSLQEAEKKNSAAAKAAEKSSSENDAAGDEEEDTAQDEETAGASVDLAPYNEAVSIASTGVKNAQDAYDTAKDTLSTATKNADKAKSEYKKARAQVDKLTVEAPNAGTVANVKLVKGQGVVAAAATGGVMSIVDTGALTCVVRVPESQVSNVTKGQSAVVRCEALGGKELSATVSRIADVPSEVQEEESSEGGAVMGDPNQSNTTYYDVTLALGKTDASMKVGMSASADIRVRDFGTVYYVPATAVASNNAGMYVEAVLDATTTKQYSVTQLATTEDGQLVIQGVSLSEGMNIRTDLSAGV